MLGLGIVAGSFNPGMKDMGKNFIMIENNIILILYFIR